MSLTQNGKEATCVVEVQCGTHLLFFVENV